MAQSETRKDILKLAQEHLLQSGFNAFSFQTLADELGIRKASIHYHFVSKEQMGVAVIENYVQSFLSWGLSVENYSPKRKLEMFLKIFERFALDHCKICPTGVLSSDFNTLPRSMRLKLQELHEVQRGWLMQILLDLKQRQELNSQIDLESWAELIMSAIQGGLQIARIRQDIESFRRVLRLLKNQLFG